MLNLLNLEIIMVLLPFVAVAMALNTALVVRLADFVTEQDESENGYDSGHTRECAEPIVGM